MKTDGIQKFEQRYSPVKRYYSTILANGAMCPVWSGQDDILALVPDSAEILFGWQASSWTESAEHVYQYKPEYVDDAVAQFTGPEDNWEQVVVHEHLIKLSKLFNMTVSEVTEHAWHCVPAMSDTLNPPILFHMNDTYAVVAPYIDDEPAGKELHKN